MPYTVRQLARLSGVSIRALHHYDAIGLLRPRTRSEAGYRLYTEAELLRLQEILLYKTLGLPLREIHALLDSNDQDTLTTLSRHREALLERQQELGAILVTVDNTLARLRGESDMSDEQLYDSFPAQAKQYREEAITKYGEARIKQSEAALRRLSTQQREALQREFETLWETLAAHSDQDATGSEAQALIARHYQLTRQFWGSETEQDSQCAMYEGLGTLFMEDERFTALDGLPRPHFARFMRDGICHYCATHTLM